jgi:excisionase family DNA binding protein
MATAAVSSGQEKFFVGRYTAAQMLEVSTRVIDDAIKNGSLSAFRIGRRVLIRREDLLAFAQRESVLKIYISEKLSKPKK